MEWRIKRKRKRWSIINQLMYKTLILLQILKSIRASHNDVITTTISITCDRAHKALKMNGGGEFVYQRTPVITALMSMSPTHI